jgi:hypothetical protein
MHFKNATVEHRECKYITLGLLLVLCVIDLCDKGQVTLMNYKKVSILLGKAIPGTDYISF